MGEIDAAATVPFVIVIGGVQAPARVSLQWLELEGGELVSEGRVGKSQKRAKRLNILASRRRRRLLLLGARSSRRAPK